MQLKKRTRYSPTRTTSSVHSQTTSLDSGLGSSEGYSTGRSVTPIHSLTHAYIKEQTMLNQLLPTREKEAQAAAISLISNLPQPALLSSRNQRTLRHHSRRLSQPKDSYMQHHQHQQHPQSTPSISQSSHRQQQQQLSQSSGGSRSTSGGDTLIVYHLDDFPTPFAKRLGGREITLSDFKEKVFLRKGEYR